MPLASFDFTRRARYFGRIMITVTDSAVKQLHALIAGQTDATGKGLRIFVEAGGCAGMQYGMALDETKEGDAVIEREGVRVFVDAFSAKYLTGSTIDFSDDLAGAGFRILNPNASRSCGCGTSFESGEHAHAGH
jgi:iron-sulfur cluster assembly accessory protein